MSNFLCIFNRSEYIALLVSVVAICINVYISYKNRRHALAKEEYFKLQQVVEKIIAKLMILNNHQEKLKTYLELIFKTSKSSKAIFIDSNNTFDRSSFDKNGEDVTAAIDIYFGDLGQEWNDCLIKMSDLFTQVFILKTKLEFKEAVEWKMEIDLFNKKSLELADKPKNMADKLKQKLKNFKKENL